MKSIVPTYLCLIVQAIFLTMFSTQAFAQRETSVWYFGSLAGLDFNIPPGTLTAPSEVTTSALNSSEGCAVECDRTTGQILFYTDGRTVFDRTNVAMTNGTGLNGGGSSTQA